MNTEVSSRLKLWFKLLMLLMIVWLMPRQLAILFNFHIPYLMSENPATLIHILIFTIYVVFVALGFLTELKFTEKDWGWSLIAPWSGEKQFFQSKRKSWNGAKIKGQILGPIINLRITPSSTPFSVIWNTTHTNFSDIKKMIRKSVDLDKMDVSAKKIWFLRTLNG